MNLFTRAIGATAIPQEPYVLLVDDEATSVGPLEELVRLSGFATVATRSATDALACCFHRRPHLVVTDLVMPGPDGRALARRVRRRYPNVPILLVTGQNLESPDWAFPGDMFQEVFSKPLDLDRFLTVLGKHMPAPRRRTHGRGRP